MTAGDRRRPAGIAGLGCRTAVLVACGATLLVACGSGDAGAGESNGPGTVTDVWARTTPAGTTVGAVYLTAAGETADALVGASVAPEVAASAMLHSTTTSASGEASMEARPELDVPAGGELVLEPAGNHIMLVDLAAPLDAGRTFELTLHFRVAGDEVVTVEVRDEAP